MKTKKTDLRVIKTKSAIKETFLEMRRTIPLEKIHVQDICNRAMINKSTFYCHYADAFALSDELENEAISTFLDKFKSKDCLFTNPELFLSEMQKIYNENEYLFMPLFKDRMDIAFQKLRTKLKEYYCHDKMTQADEIKLTFVIGGAFHAMQEMKFQKHLDDDILASNVATLISKL